MIVGNLPLTCSAGVLASCTYVQRLNVLGGGAPESLIALPTWNGIPNYEATFPYQVNAATMK
jgi:hypothetical protein